MIEELNVEYEYVDLTKESIDFDTLNGLYQKLDLPIKKFFNTSGMDYRNNNIKDLFDKLSDEELLKLITENGMLLKRPFIIGKRVYIGKQLDEIMEDYSS